MANHLRSSDRAAIKAEWVEIFRELLQPLLEHPERVTKPEAPIRLQYMLSPGT
jgi:hypothetical protein